MAMTSRRERMTLKQRRNRETTKKKKKPTHRIYKERMVKRYRWRRSSVDKPLSKVLSLSLLLLCPWVSSVEELVGFSESPFLLALIQPKISTFSNNSALQFLGIGYFFYLSFRWKMSTVSSFFLFSLSSLQLFWPCFCHVLCVSYWWEILRKRVGNQSINLLHYLVIFCYVKGTSFFFFFVSHHCLTIFFIFWCFDIGDQT